MVGLIYISTTTRTVLRSCEAIRTLPVVRGEGEDGGEDGEGGEGGGEDVEPLVTGATRCGGLTEHGCVLTWSDLSSSHHHQHEATEAPHPNYHMCTTVSLTLPLTTTPPPDYTYQSKCSSSLRTS